MSWIQKTEKIVHVCVIILLAVFIVLGLMGRLMAALAVLGIGATLIGVGCLILLIIEDMVQTLRDLRKKSTVMEGSRDPRQVPADIDSKLTAAEAMHVDD